MKERFQKPASTLPANITQQQQQSQHNFHTATPIVESNKRKKSMKNASLRNSPKRGSPNKKNSKKNSHNKDGTIDLTKLACEIAPIS